MKAYLNKNSYLKKSMQKVQSFEKKAFTKKFITFALKPHVLRNFIPWFLGYIIKGK